MIEQEPKEKVTESSAPTAEEIKQALDEAIEQAVKPKQSSAKLGIVLWNMGSWALMGFDDGEIGIATARFMRTHPASGWKSQTHKRVQADEDEAVIYLRRPDAPTQLVNGKSPTPVRDFLHQSESRLISTAEKYTAYEMVDIYRATIFLDMPYTIWVGYSTLSRTWVVSRRPEPQPENGIWGLGISVVQVEVLDEEPTPQVEDPYEGEVVDLGYDEGMAEDYPL